MHSRAARVLLAAILLVIGIGAALLASTTVTRINILDSDQRAVLTRLDRLDGIAADIGAAQAAYVAPGQPDAPWFERVTALTQELSTGLMTIRPKARSVEAAARLRAIDEASERLLEADRSARDHVRQDENLMAADVVFGEGREAVTAIRSALKELRGFEETAFDSARAGLAQQLMLIPGIAAAIWLIGVLLLVRIPTVSTDAAPVIEEPMREPAPDVAAAPATVDLAAAADLCTALSRVTSSKALPDMLARAAALLDASGVIVWMGAGEELFAATSHGYDPRIIRRLGPIPRAAENATAAAWRTGELRTVPGDMMSNGAIVAPMFGPDSCIGVLAAEVRHGREDDASTRAVTVMVAAQLSTVLSAWPAASTPPRAAEA